MRPTRRQLFIAIGIGGPARIGMAYPMTWWVVAPCVLIMLALALAALRWPRVMLGEDRDDRGG